jgi:hypothetical protein
MLSWINKRLDFRSSGLGHSKPRYASRRNKPNDRPGQGPGQIICNGPFCEYYQVNKELTRFIYLFFYFSAIQVHYHIWWEQGSRSYLQCTCRSLPPWAGVQPPELMGPIYSELLAPFATVELHLFPLDVRAVFFFPSNFARRALPWIFIALENHEPSSGVEPGSSRSIVRSSSTKLAGPD